MNFQFKISVSYLAWDAAVSWVCLTGLIKRGLLGCSTWITLEFRVIVYSFYSLRCSWDFFISSVVLRATLTWFIRFSQISFEKGYLSSFRTNLSQNIIILSVFIHNKRKKEKTKTIYQYILFKIIRIVINKS